MIWKFENSSSGLENFECRSFRIFNDGSECGYAMEGEKFFLYDKSNKTEIRKIFKETSEFNEIFKNIKKDKIYNICFALYEKFFEKYYVFERSEIEFLKNSDKFILLIENEKDDSYSIKLF